MNNNQTGFYADLVVLITGIVMLVSFLALPFIIPSVTAIQIISLDSLTNGIDPSVGSYFSLWSSLLIFFLVITLLATVVDGIGLGMRQHSRNISFLVLGCGSVCLLILLMMLVQIATLANNGFGLALSLMGIGYWLLFLGSIWLIVQVFIPRNLVLGINQNVPQMPPMPPVQSAPRQPFSPTMQATMMPQQPQPAPMSSQKPPVNAWLIDVQSNTSYQLRRGETRIGRSRQRNDIVLNSQRVSREHALIRQEGNHFVIYSVGAQVPVYVNGQNIQGQHVLTQQEELTLGDLVLRFVQA